MDKGLIGLRFLGLELEIGDLSGGPLFSVFESLVVFVGAGVDALLFGDVFFAGCAEREDWSVGFERVVEEGHGDRRRRLPLALLIGVVGHGCSRQQSVVNKVEDVQAEFASSYT